MKKRGRATVNIMNAHFEFHPFFLHLHGIITFNYCSFIHQFQEIYIKFYIYGSQYKQTAAEDQWRNETMSPFETVSFNRSIKMYKSDLMSINSLNIYIFRTSCKIQLSVILSLPLSSRQHMKINFLSFYFKLIMVQ